MIIGSSQQVITGALDVLIVVLAIQELGLGDAGAGFLIAALGFGGVLGGIAASALVGRHRLLPAMAFGVLVKTLALALIPVVLLAGLLLASVGAGHSLVDVANRTLLQRSVPLEALGRSCSPRRKWRQEELDGRFGARDAVGGDSSRLRTEERVPCDEGSRVPCSAICERHHSAW